jgi:very-short-patch-repair endonuclease
MMGLVIFHVDFYCHKASLVVEVDRGIHDLQHEENARRGKALREWGLRVVRFRIDEVLKNASRSALRERSRELVFMRQE